MLLGDDLEHAKIGFTPLLAEIRHAIRRPLAIGKGRTGGLDLCIFLGDALDQSGILIRYLGIDIDQPLQTGRLCLEHGERGAVAGRVGIRRSSLR